MNNETWKNTKGEPVRVRNNRSRTTRRTHEVPFIFIAGRSHVTQKTRFRALASFPTQAPCDVLLCDVKSHTTLLLFCAFNVMYCDVMYCYVM